ncbi:hypothetical protein BDZ45DRAFT_748268 [Acephala macrosclerotiorum]|nr:hypothetical protein BDZ45DRAFT_748268 [Acephala macrosclerotiorum]
MEGILLIVEGRLAMEEMLTVEEMLMTFQGLGWIGWDESRIMLLLVFSACLLEMQHRRLEYTKVMSLILTRGFEQQQKDVVIFLGCLSKRLVRWLCAILAPGAGWVIQGSVPPWAAHFGPEDVQFVISTHHSSDNIAQEAPPSSAEATDLRYYMTLSLSVRSAIWSIFWELGI